MSSPRLQLPDLGAPVLEQLLERTSAVFYAVDAEERIV